MDKKSVKLTGLITKLTLAANRVVKKKRNEKRTAANLTSEPLLSFRAKRYEGRTSAFRLID